MLDSLSLSTILLLGAATILLTITMLYPRPLLRWLKLKRYQYEVTFSLYMLTPTEKFVFNSILFLILSLLIIAACFYLPEHVSTISNRLFYYWFGDEKDQLASSQSRLLSSTSRMVRSAATAFLENKERATGAAKAAAAGLKGNGRGVMEL